MTRKEANMEAKKVFEWFSAQRELVELQAKREGIWQSVGLDSNQYLCKPLMTEAKNELAAIKESIDEF